jgi:hypothetical protein
MIITGNIPVTWNSKDYESCEYKTHPNPYRGFDPANEEDNTATKLDIGLDVCYKIPETILLNLKHFNLLNMSLQLQKYSPGQYLPFHSDRYDTYKKFNKIPKDNDIIRIIVFLHDQEPGQQLWVENKIYTGVAGDYIGWTNDTVHMAANLSNVDRYNLQITGTQQTMENN